jgi:hypothetical protein
VQLTAKVGLSIIEFCDQAGNSEIKVEQSYLIERRGAGKIATNSSQDLALDCRTDMSRYSPSMCEQKKVPVGHTSRSSRDLDRTYPRHALKPVQ